LPDTLGDLGPGGLAVHRVAVGEQGALVPLGPRLDHGPAAEQRAVIKDTNVGAVKLVSAWGEKGERRQPVGGRGAAHTIDQ